MANLAVGTRSLRATLFFTRMLRACGSVAQPVLVTSDEFTYYARRVRRTFGPTCVYLQVDNPSARGRILRSKASLELGNEGKVVAMTRDDVESLVGRVLRTWRESRIDMRPSDPRSGTRFQERFGATLPADVAAFLCAHGGMPEGTSDANLIRFWSLDEVVPVSTLMPGSGADFDSYFLFADYSLWAHGYAVRISPSHGTDVVIAGGERPVVVASSFPEFLAKYLTDPSALF